MEKGTQHDDDDDDDDVVMKMVMMMMMMMMMMMFIMFVEYFFQQIARKGQWKYFLARMALPFFGSLYGCPIDNLHREVRGTTSKHLRRRT